MYITNTDDSNSDMLVVMMIIVVIVVVVVVIMIIGRRGPELLRPRARGRGAARRPVCNVMCNM